MFSAIWEKIKEIINKMLGTKSVEQVLNISSSVSGVMAAEIELWSNMYEGRAPWLREPTFESPTRVTSLGLPALIASEKARMATLEMETEITAPMQEIEKPNPDYIPPSTDEFGNMSMGRGTMTIKEDVPIGSTDRADFLNDQYKKLKKQIRRQLEYGIAKGGLVIKPYPIIYDDFVASSNTESKNVSATNYQSNAETDEKSKPSTSPTDSEKNIDNNVEVKEKKQFNAEIGFDFVQADGFYPLAFDASGKVIEAAFIQRKVDKDEVYSRVEYHKLEKKVITVKNMAFKAKTGDVSSNTMLNSDLGEEIPLKSVPEWSNLEPEIQIKDVDRLLFAYFKMPEANTIDTYSPLGVSGYSRVVSLIKDADMQYSRLLWEYEGGEMAIDVDRDALKIVDERGQDITKPNILQERLFRKVDLNAEDTYNVFAPTLRDAAYTAGLNAILMRIEDATGMSRGTISDSVSYEAKTATELKILKQRSYATNADIQMALEDALRDVVYIMDVYCSLYGITPEGDYDVSFEWDDSILIDSESELSKRLTLMQNGLASKKEIRMWYFGETENQAKAKLQEIEDEQKQAIEDNMMAQSQLGEMAQQQSGNFKNPNSNNQDAPTQANTNKNKIENNKSANGTNNSSNQNS